MGRRNTKRRTKNRKSPPEGGLDRPGAGKAGEPRPRRRSNQQHIED